MGCHSMNSRAVLALARARTTPRRLGQDFFNQPGAGPAAQPLNGQGGLGACLDMFMRVLIDLHVLRIPLRIIQELCPGGQGLQGFDVQCLRTALFVITLGARADDGVGNRLATDATHGLKALAVRHCPCASRGHGLPTVKACGGLQRCCCGVGRGSGQGRPAPPMQNASNQVTVITPVARKSPQVPKITIRPPAILRTLG